MSDYEILGVSEYSNIVEIDLVYKNKITLAYRMVANREDDIATIINLYKAYNNIMENMKRNPVKMEVNNFIMYSSIYEGIDILNTYLNFLNYYNLVDRTFFLDKMRRLLENIWNELYKIVDMLRRVKTMGEFDKVKIFYEKKCYILLINFKNEFLNYIDAFYPGIIYTKENKKMLEEFNSLDSFNLIPYFLRNNMEPIGEDIELDNIMGQENKRIAVIEPFTSVKEDYDKNIISYVKKHNLSMDDYIIRYGNEKYYKGLSEKLRKNGMNIYDDPTL